MTVQRIQRGDPLSAAQQNQMIDQLNALGAPGATGGAQYGSAGVTFDSPPQGHGGLFELVDDMVYPDPNGMSPDALDREPMPYAKAKRVWCHQQRKADRTPQGDPVRSYGGIEHSAETTVWHPTAWRNGDGYAYGPAAFCTGQRVWCLWNRQSGRWEIDAPAMNLWQFELADVCMPQDSEVAAILPDDPSEPSLILYRTPGMCHGVGRSGGIGYAGTTGFAIWMPVRRRWEMLAGNFKLVSEGITCAAIPNGSAGTVRLSWLDYESYQLVDSGQQVNAGNWLHPQIPAGTKVLVSYDRQEDRWTILASEPGAGYQPLDVVTSVSLTTHAGAYYLEYTTRQIQLPAWVTIGPPTQHS